MTREILVLILDIVLVSVGLFINAHIITKNSVPANLFNPSYPS